MPDLKKTFRPILFMLIFAGCHKTPTLHRPDEPAKYHIAVEIQPSGLSSSDAEMKEAFELLVAYAESNGMIYQSIERSPAENRITFHVIGLLTENGEEDPGPDHFVRLLGRKPSLEFWEVYRNMDEPVGATFLWLFKRHGLSKYLADAYLFLTPEYSFQTAVLAEVAPENILHVDSIFRLPEVLDSLPPNMVFALSLYPSNIPEKSNFYELFALKKSTPSGPFLTGRDVLSTEGYMDEGTDEFSIGLEFRPDAALVWAEKTRQAALDSRREIAIVMDGRVISAPRVMNEISSGRSQITGNFGMAESRRVINQLKLGALAAEWRVSGLAR